jgi:ParB-like chromosome segregation protein Spo0J
MSDLSYIAEDLRPLATPLDLLSPFPGNPRRGDVEAVKRSYERFGQRKPIVAQRDGTVIAGNHQLKAAQRLGWSHIAVVWTDDDELTAKAFALADNRTGDLGGYDDIELIELLQTVAVDPDLLNTTGYEESFIADLIKRYEVPSLDALAGVYGESDEDMPSEKLAVIKLLVRREVEQRWSNYRKSIDGDASGDNDEAFVNHILDRLMDV